MSDFQMYPTGCICIDDLEISMNTYCNRQTIAYLLTLLVYCVCETAQKKKSLDNAFLE